jgi:tetratricopeptide (TPR) repeat protein
VRLIAAVLSVTLTTGAAGAQVPPDTAKEAQRRYKAGVELMSPEKCGEAAIEFKAAVGLDPLLALAHYNLGQCHMMTKDYVAALTAFTDCREAFERLSSMSQDEREGRERMRRDEITELKDDLSRLKFLTSQGDTHADITALGMRMEERLRQLESMQHKDRAGKSTVPAGVYLAFGSAYFRLGQLEDAEREYRQAARIDARLGAAHNNLAVIYLVTGRPDEAEVSMQLAEKNGFRVSPAFKEHVKAAKPQ